MVERLGSDEERETVNEVRERVTRHFLERGHRLTEKELSRLITSVEVRDLSNSRIADAYGRPPLAKVRGQELTLDHRFNELDLNQQTRLLLHEYSHPLDTYFQRQGDPRYISLLEQIASLPTHQVSYYSSFLTEKFGDDPEKASLLQRERTAEILAQYLASDRTFSGFIQAKLLEFPRQSEELTEGERVHFEKLYADVGNLGEYISIADSEQEYEDFLAHHSDLLPHYQLWKELGAFMADVDFSQLPAAELIEHGAENDDEELEEIWEALELVESVHPEPVVPGRVTQTVYQPTESPKAQQPTPFSDLVAFWRVFPD